MRKTILAILVSAATGVAAQPGTVNMTPVRSFNLRSVPVEVPAKYQAAIGNYSVMLPQGYKAKIFYAGGLMKPRFMAFAPNGVLHVSDMTSATGQGKVYALPDLNDDGEADTIIAVAGGFTNNHDVKFYKNNMYVTETFKVWRQRDIDNNGSYETKELFIDSIGMRASSGGHSTRTIVFDSINGKAYVSVGSQCNACRETYRAIIEQYNDNGTGRRTYASGIRNAVGMTIHPVTNRLWANNNGSDQQGDHIPPEWTDLVRDGGFYGYPVAYANQVWFDFDAHNDYKALKPITAADTANVSKMIEPAGLIQAHSAPMALTFLNGSFPAAIKNGLLMALRGSWNTPQNYKGYKLVYMDLNSVTDTTFNYVADFCGGFITDTINRIYWGRPVGLAIDEKGRIFMSSDEGNKFIMMIYPDGSNINLGGGEMNKRIGGLTLYPNPADRELNVSFETKSEENVVIKLVDIRGAVILQQVLITQAGSQSVKLSTSEIPAGIYSCVIEGGGEILVKRFACIR